MKIRPDHTIAGLCSHRVDLM